MLKVPCEMTVRRYIERLDPYALDCAHLGKYAAARKHRNAIGVLEVKQIQDRWEIDHTLLDVLLVDPETGEVIGRPYITVVLDRFSRMVMGFLIHLTAPNTESVLRVIERAIRPKQGWLERFPSVTSPWRARGLPLRIVPDNAAEFHADDLIQAFNDLGIEILYPRSRGPQMKGAVERFFRTLNDALIHRLPGTTFSNTKQRGDYPSEERACITLPELESCVMKWIVDVYHQRSHRGLGKKTPVQVWEAGESERSLCLPADLDGLESVLASRKLAPVHHYGIETDGVTYHSSELAELRLRLEEDEKVDIRLRDELGHIWVKDRFRSLFILVPAKNKRFNGLSRDIYRQARKQVRENKGNANDHDTVIVAYRQIMAEVDAAKASNKLRKRRQAARARLDKEGRVRPEPPTPEKSISPKRSTALPNDRADLPQPKIRPRAH
jgi:putative transposase